MLFVGGVPACVASGYITVLPPYERRQLIRTEYAQRYATRKGPVYQFLFWLVCWMPPRPPPLPRDAPAGMVPKFGDRSNDPLPNSLNWMTTGTSRPVSRRATGSARPATASSITFG